MIICLSSMRYSMCPSFACIIKGFRVSGPYLQLISKDFHLTWCMYCKWAEVNWAFQAEICVAFL